MLLRLKLGSGAMVYPSTKKNGHPRSFTSTGTWRYEEGFSVHHSPSAMLRLSPLFPESRYDEDKRQKAQRPLGVGHVSKNGPELRCDLSLPKDALTAVLVVLAAGKFRRVEMRGQRMKYGKALLNGFSLNTSREWDRTDFL
jgi:hypothetical protein